MDLKLHNTLTGKKESFTPLDAEHIRMYVCGPTVYARPHIGNARSVVVYDVLFRLLKHLYPKVTYARNITDVDDKINAAATERGITIQALTQEVTGWFHDDMDALNCERPTIEPKATEHISQIIQMIERLIANGNAYIGSDGKHVLFDVTSKVSSRGLTTGYSEDDIDPAIKSRDDGFTWRYGMLSGRKLEDQESGVRIAVADYKKNAGDFVLWKPAADADDESSKFESPWGVGRPGWHIECSAMSTEYLGETFDIHGGGADLKFPHHENEIAQSCCANPQSQFAKYWVHNGFLTVNGEKMSKSLGNFVTVRDLLDKGIKGEVIRLALLMSKYNEPLDWNDDKVREAEKLLDKWYRVLSISHPRENGDIKIPASHTSVFAGMTEFMDALADDMNTPKALSLLQQVSLDQLRAAGALLGILQQEPEQWFKGESDDDSDIQAQIDARIKAKNNKDWATSDRIRDELKAQGIILEDRPDGSTDWRKG